MITRLETYRSLLTLYMNRFNVDSAAAEAARIEKALTHLYNQLEKGP